MEDEGSLNHEKEWDEWKKRLKDERRGKQKYMNDIRKSEQKKV